MNPEKQKNLDFFNQKMGSCLTSEVRNQKSEIRNQRSEAAAFAEASARQGEEGVNR